MAGGLVLEEIGPAAVGVHERATTCPVCQKTLVSPKTLKCAHTLCEKCVVGLTKAEDEVTCPVCMTKTQLPTGGVSALPTNFLVSRLLEQSVVTGEGGEPKPDCDLCIEPHEADWDCRDCEAKLCHPCALMHRRQKMTAGHAVMSLADPTVSLPSKPTTTMPPATPSTHRSMPSQEQFRMCTVHADQPLRVYCQTCEVVICSDCTVKDHPSGSHDVGFIAEMAKAGKAEVKALLAQATTKSEELARVIQANVDNRNSRRERAVAILGEVDKATDTIVQALKARRDEIHAQMGQLIGQADDDEGANEVVVQGARKRLDHLLSLMSNSLAKGNDLELLDLKRAMREELRSLEVIIKPKKLTNGHRALTCPRDPKPLINIIHEVVGPVGISPPRPTDVKCTFVQRGSIQAFLDDGWTVALAQPYSEAFSLSALSGLPDKSLLMVGGRKTGSDTILLGAIATKEHVIVPTSNNDTRRLGDVYWYNGSTSGMRSFGFADSPVIALGNADSTPGEKRLCWLTTGSNGYRLGDMKALYAPEYERLILVLEAAHQP